MNLLNLARHSGFEAAAMCSKMKLGCLCNVTLIKYHTARKKDDKVEEKMSSIVNVFLKGSISFYILIDFKSFLVGPLCTINRIPKTYGCSHTCVEETSQELFVNCCFKIKDTGLKETSDLFGVFSDFW